MNKHDSTLISRWIMYTEEGGVGSGRALGKGEDACNGPERERGFDD